MMIVTCFIVDTESMLKAMISPEVIVFVHPVRVESVYLFPEEIVGLAAAVIVSANVGG